MESTIDEDIPTTDISEVRGHGSVRSTVNLEARRRSRSTNNITITNARNNAKVDVGLILKLQHKLIDTEKKKVSLQKRLDQIELSRKSETSDTALRIAQLELANFKLKMQLYELRNSTEDENVKYELKNQMKVVQEELVRRSEEIIHKGVLVNQADNMINCRLKTGEYIDEDGELALAHETQKAFNKQLELQLQDEKAKYEAYEKEVKLEIEKLRGDNERQQHLLLTNLPTSPQSQTEAFLRHEITRLATENLDLQDQNDSLNETIRKLKILGRKLRKRELDFDDALNKVTIKDDDKKETNIVPRSRLVESKPEVRKKKKKCLGMFSFNTSDENAIMKQLIFELKPAIAVTLLPGLPAYIVFMCVRYTDYIKAEHKAQTLLAAFTNSVMKVVKKHRDFHTLVLWLSNTLRLLHCIKQYSGDKSLQNNNSPKQNEHLLQYFDLSRYIQVFTDIAVWIHEGLLGCILEKIQPLIVPAILENEEVPGIGRNKMSGFGTDALLQELTCHYKIFTFYGVDPEVILLILKQEFYYLCAFSLNNLLTRKELCHWSKGLQISHNLARFEMWTREKQLDEQSMQSILQPIIQAAHLLQTQKTDEDVESVCEMCNALTPLQICNILNLYTPVDEFEQRVPASFINKVEAKLQERPNYQEEQTLQMDTQYCFPIEYSFNPSVICFDDIEIPEVLKLSKLKKL